MSENMISKEAFSEEGYALVGAAFEVHRELGGGLAEEIYQQSLEIEMSSRGIPYASKVRLAVAYKGQRLNTFYVPDMVVHQAMVVEMKAVQELTSDHESQLLNYMHLTKMPVGYLLNFGPHRGVEWKRMILSQYVG